MIADYQTTTAALPAEPRLGKHRNALIALALALATAAVYGQTVWHDFEFLNVDDDEYVTRAPQVQAGISTDGLYWAFTTFHAYNWHPLTWISLQLDSTLFDLNPRCFHLTNVLLHTANTLLVFWLLLRMTGDIWPSAFVAALFGLHPAHVESVAWVAERKDVLSTLFWLLTTLAYVRYADRPGLPRYLLMLVLFTLGLMAKPMLVTLPATLLLLDYWPLHRFDLHGAWKRLVLEKLPLFALVAASLPLTILAQKAAIRSFEQMSLVVRLNNALVSYAQYIGMLFWPSDLAVFYPHPRDAIPDWNVAAAAVLLVAISAAAIVLARRRPYLFVGWLWYLGTLVPVIGLMQVGVHALADRYTYVPHIGLGVMVAWGGADLAARSLWARRLAATAAIMVLAACFGLTWRQVGFWRDSVTLWQRTVAVTRDNPLAYDYLARELVRRGRLGEAVAAQSEALRLLPRAPWMHGNLGVALEGLGRLDEAAAEFEQALRLDANAQDAVICHTGLGRVRESQGRLAEAREHFAAAARLEPNSPLAHFHVGRLLVALGQASEALSEYDAALSLAPEYGEAHNNKGVALERLGRLGEAAASYRKAAALEADNYIYRCNLAHALYEDGKMEQAAAQYREASRLKPDWPQLALEEAWHKATHPDAKVRNGRQALRLARQACQATGFRQPQPLDVLAAACAEIGRFDDAVRFETQAIAALSAGGPPDALREARERLRLYEAKKPYRQP